MAHLGFFILVDICKEIDGSVLPIVEVFSLAVENLGRNVLVHHLILPVA